MVWQLIRRDFVSSYRFSVLGIVWKVILPIIPVSVYVILQVAGILKSSSEMPKALYVSIGITLWHFFSGNIRYTVTCMDQFASVLTKTKVPLIVIYLSGLGALFFDFLIRFVLILGLLIYLQVGISWQWVLLPLLLLPFFVLSMGLGVLASFFNLYAKDIKNIVTVALTYGLFISAAIFPIGQSSTLWKVVLYNPAYHLIDGTRQFLVFGSLPQGNYYFMSCLVSVLIFAYTMDRLRALEKRLVSAL